MSKQRDISFAGQDERILEAAKLLAYEVQTQGHGAVKPRALFVGGFVRDTLLGVRSKDADVEVYGLEAGELEKLLQRLFPGRVNPVGRSFGIYKISLADGAELDVALPRRESKTGVGHRGFSVQGDPTMSFEQAARRRDFSLNAMGADILSNEILDPLGGMKDLAARRLRITDPEHFAEDPLRVYRAMQFVARFGLEVEAQTQKLMRQMVQRGDLAELSAERISEEWKKLLLAARPESGFDLGRALGVFEKQELEFAALAQDEKAWTEFLSRLESTAQALKDFTSEEKLQGMLVVVLSRLDEQARANFWTRHTFSANRIIRPVEKMSAAEFTDDFSDNALRILCKRLYPVHPRIFLALHDISATQKERILSRLAGHSEWLENPKSQTLLTGHELVDLGFVGERIGRAMQIIEQARDRGEIETKEQALDLAQKFHDGNPFA
ncbi:MAG: hypothetical protein WC641_02095 [Patescibacteria group bacterium]